MSAHHVMTEVQVRLHESDPRELLVTFGNWWMWHVLQLQRQVYDFLTTN